MMSPEPEPAPRGPDAAGEQPYRSVVEVRIHGVSGTPPEELLGRTSVRQVGGDAVAGFYRPVHREQLRDQAAGTRADRGPWLEGYSWSGWTSGARSRAFWIAFIPFALVNVAPRMLPAHAGRAGIRARTVGGLFRVLALSLTLTFLIGIAHTLSYIIALRCAQSAEVCRGLPAGLAAWISERDPALRLALALALGLLVVAALWGLSYSAARKYGRPAGDQDARQTSHPEDSAHPLSRPDLWASYGRVRRLRRLHVQAALVWMTALTVLSLPPGASRTVVLAAAAIVGAGIIGAVAHRPRLQNDVLPGLVVRAARWVPSAAVVLAGFAAAAVSAADRSPDPERAKAAFDWVITGVFVGQGAILVIVGVLVFLESRTPTAHRHPTHLGGRAAWHVAFLGWLLGAMFNASTVILAPVWLASDGLALGPATVTTVMVEKQDWFSQASFSVGAGMLFGAALIVAGLVAFGLRAGWVRWRLNGGTARDRAALAADYATVPEADRDPDRTRAVLWSFWTARRMDYISVAVRWFVWGVSVFLLLQLLVLLRLLPTSWWPWFGIAVRPLNPAAGAREATLPQAVGLGAYLTALLLVGLILVGLLSFRQRGTRRAVGVLWDLACFWPRDVHPFAPPCYTERIVPEVGKRMRAYVEPYRRHHPGRVILAAHSQGTVIAVAALAAHARREPESLAKSAVPAANRPAPSVLPRIALLTFGCVLDRLYARFFPRYFNRELFASLAAELTTEADSAPDGKKVPRWYNIWRHSDYLGGSVPYFDDHDAGPDEPGPVNVRSVDPIYAMAPEDVVFPRGGKHSGFTIDPTFHAVLGRLVSAFGPQYADCVPEPPPEPGFPEAPRSMR